MISETTHTQVDMLSPLYYWLNPFHRDGLNHLPILQVQANGRKQHLIDGMREYPYSNYSHVSQAMDAAEEECHRKHRNGVLGPAWVGQIPYPLIVATAKAEGAKTILNNQWPEQGVAVVSDAVFCMRDGNGEVAFTAHKPRSLHDIETLMQVFYEFGMHGGVSLSTWTGVVCFAFGTATPRTNELFLLRTELGLMIPSQDMGTLLQKIMGGSNTAGGIDSHFALEHLVKPRPEVTVCVRKYHPHVGYGVQNGIVQPIDGKNVVIPAHEIHTIHLTSIGVIS